MAESRECASFDGARDGLRKRFELGSLSLSIASETRGERGSGRSRGSNHDLGLDRTSVSSHADPVVTVGVMVGAFLLGGIPFGWIVARRAGVDVRAAGSGNIGATNVARTVGRTAGWVTLALDAAKGALPALVGLQIGGPRLGAGAACAAVLGHVFSPFLSFRGGKGVATAAGAFAVLSPLGTAVAMATFAVVVAVGRRVSLGSLCAAAVLTPAVWLTGAAGEIRTLALVVATVVFVRHVPNVSRLLTGTERAWADPGSIDPSADTDRGLETSGLMSERTKLQGQDQK